MPPWVVPGPKQWHGLQRCVPKALQPTPDDVPAAPPAVVPVAPVAEVAAADPIPMRDPDGEVDLGAREVEAPAPAAVPAPRPEEAKPAAQVMSVPVKSKMATTYKRLRRTKYNPKQQS